MLCVGYLTRLEDKNNKESYMSNLAEELEDNQESIYDDELAFELERLSKGVRTKPVFYD